MGMSSTVTFAGPAPSWTAIQTQLITEGLPVQLRMIDGLPAFPNENPNDGWRELRISTASGMITLRLDEQSISVIVWDNAGPDLLRERDAVVRACAAAAHGSALDS